MLKLFSIGFLALGLSIPAAADSPKIFLASTGADANDGSRLSPKRSLQAGHDAVAAGGEIVVLDTAGYGPVFITKSVSVVVPPGVNGFVTVPTANTSGVAIDAGASSIVTLRGLIIEGAGQDCANMVGGIAVGSVGTLVVEDSVVRNFCIGLDIYTTVDMRFVMRRGALRDNKYGVSAQDQLTGSRVDGLVTDTEFSNNGYGIFAQGNRGTKIYVVATRCIVTGSTDYAFYTNAGYIVVDGCTVTRNAKVFSFYNGGASYTRGNNTIVNNTAMNAYPQNLPAQ